jgi:hypothetical protein
VAGGNSDKLEVSRGRPTPPNVALAESADAPALLAAVIETLLSCGDGGRA